MRLTWFTDYGLRALMRLASEPQRGFSSAELAAEFGISRNHLIKILQCRTRAGIATSRRGSGGGVMLAAAPTSIRLGDLVRLLEQGQALVECFQPACDCAAIDMCRLRGRLQAAEAAFLAELNRSTLADIALPPRLAPHAATAQAKEQCY